METKETNTRNIVIGDQTPEELTSRSNPEAAVHTIADMLRRTSKSRLRIKHLPDRPPGLIQGN